MENTSITNKKGSLLNLLMFRYLPYWPVFLLLIVLSCTAAWYYIRSFKPLYEASATILIKDDKDEAGDAKMLESLSLLQTTKKLDNEIEIIQSKSLMKKVVDKLHLYAPVFEEADNTITSAYNSSPISIQVKDPGHLVEQHKVYFSYDGKNNAVKIDNKYYPLGVWLTTHYGTLLFTKNEKQELTTSNSLFFDLIQPGSIASTYRESLSVAPVSKSSSVVELRIRDDVAQRAEDILNTLADVYSQLSIADKNALSVNTLAFLEDRIKFVENDLDSLERKIQGYKTQKGIVDLSTQGKIYLENVSSNDQHIADINMQLAVLDQVEKYVMYKDNKAGIVPATLGLNDQILTDLLQKLYSTEVRYEQLRKTSLENNPALITLKSEIEQIRPSILENIRNQRITLLTSAKKLDVANNSYASVLSKIPKQEKDLLDYSRRQAIKSSVYTFLLQKREETALSLSATIADNKVIDPAEAYSIPHGPSAKIVYLMAVAFGILASVAFITIKDYGNTKVQFRSELEGLTTIPVVAELSKVKEKSPLVVNDVKHLFVAEQFRHLRAAIGLYGKNTNKIRLMVTSSISGEGKSFVSANLALSLALAGKKVALIDLDIRNPKVSDIFNFKNTPGVAEYLEGKVDFYEIIKQSQYEHLHIIPAGSGTVNPTELLLDERLELLFNRLSELFHYVIIDTSPIDPVSDAYVLSQYCNVVLLIIRHGFTPKTTVQLLDENNTIKALKNVAIVFNGVKSRGFTNKGYGYGYGYGYEKIYRYQEYNKT